MPEDTAVITGPTRGIFQAATVVKAAIPPPTATAFTAYSPVILSQLANKFPAIPPAAEQAANALPFYDLN